MRTPDHIDCPRCDYQVSRHSEFCPACGQPIRQHRILVVFVAIAVGLVMGEIITKLFVQQIG